MKKIRYFFVSYFCKENGNDTIGNVTFECDRFPSLANIRKELKNETIFIINIFEFQDKEDYDNFEEK